MSISEVLQILFESPWGILLGIFFFGATIFVHELGHFLAARWRGMVVERFSIGFGPKIVSFRRDGVDYRISWLPLGGYVALPQLADLKGIEGDYQSDTSRLPPVSFSDKVIVAGAGAFFNILFALMLGTILWVVGFPQAGYTQSTVIGSVSETITLPDGSVIPSPAAEAGLQPLDRILSIDGVGIEDWSDIQRTILTGTGRGGEGQPEATFTIERDGERMNLTVRPALAGEEGTRLVGISPRQTLVVGSILPDSPAAKAGLQPGDQLLAVNGEPVYSSIPYARSVETAWQEGPRPLTLMIDRAGETRTLQAVPEAAVVDEAGNTEPLLGIQWARDTIIIHQNPVAWIWDHMKLTGRMLYSLLHTGSDIGLRHMSGPPGILYTLSVFSSSLPLVVWLMVLINVNLAILNLLPIPVLDGGHILFATIGKLRGKALPAKWIINLQSAFMMMLLAVMVYVMFFDIGRVGRDIERRAQPDRITPVFQTESAGGTSVEPSNDSGPTGTRDAGTTDSATPAEK